MPLIRSEFYTGTETRDGNQLVNLLLSNESSSSNLATMASGAVSTGEPASSSLLGATFSHSPVHQLPGFTDLIAVLFECFSIISLGYLSCRFKLISPEAKDLSAYLSTFALPMIIFLNIAQMEFQTINLSFLFCMLISKLLLFATVTVFTLAISYPRNFSYAGALSILATQSNDFALGYPLVKSLYGETKPEMLSYLSLMAPIQLLILNPLGIVMLEFEKSRQRAKKAQRQQSNNDNNESDHEEVRECKRCTVQGGIEGSMTMTPASGHQRQQKRNESLDGIMKIEQIPNDNHIVNGDDERELVAGQHQCDGLIASRDEVSDRKWSNSFLQANGQIIGCLHPSVIGKKDLSSMIHSSWSSETQKDFGIVHHECPFELNLKATPPAVNSPRAIVPSYLNCSVSCSEESIDLLNCQLVGCANAPLNRSRKPSTLGDVNIVSRRTRPKLLGLLDGGGGSGLDARSDSLGAKIELSGNGAQEKEEHCRCKKFASQKGRASQTTTKEPLVDLSFLKALATNPLIIASIAALAVNLTYGPELPKFVTKVSNTIAASFAAPALLIIGLSMYGKFELLSRNPNDLLLATTLVMSKVIILPNLMRTTALILLPYYTTSEEIPYLTDFSYLYGLLPAAPGACIIAKQYGVLGNVVSITMLLSTFISAPLMLGASYIINQTSDTIDLNSIMNLFMQTIRVSSVVTLSLSLVTLYVLLRIDKQVLGNIRRGCGSSIGNVTARVSTNAMVTAAAPTTLRVTHLYIFLLAVAQLVIGIGGSLWLITDYRIDDGDEEVMRSIVHIWLAGGKSDGTLARVICTMQYIFSSGGILMARFVVLSMVMTTFAFRYRGHRLASRVIALMFRVLPLLGLGLLLSLVLESGHSRCSPTEASLPNWSVSLHLRLIYNVIVLVLAVPTLTATFRMENKAYAAANELEEAVGRQQRRRESRERHTSNSIRCFTGNAEDELIIVERHSVASSPSLSSTITTNTNLEYTNVVNPSLRPPAASAVLDCGALDQLFDDDSTLAQQEQRKQLRHQYTGTSHANPVYRHDQQNHVLHIEDVLYHTTEAAPDSSPAMNIPTQSTVDIDTNNNSGTGFRSNIISSSHHDVRRRRGSGQQGHDPDLPQETKSPGLRCYGFSKYSILIVFMLIQVVLNMTSIIQVLFQDKPFGTLIQVEITTVALDFGQGLLTFLVIGTQRFPRYLIS